MRTLVVKLDWVFDAMQEVSINCVIVKHFVSDNVLLTAIIWYFLSV